MNAMLEPRIAVASTHPPRTGLLGEMQDTWHCATESHGYFTFKTLPLINTDHTDLR
jgi:hypothetical protein